MCCDHAAGLYLKLLLLPLFAPLSYFCGIALFSFYHSAGHSDPVEDGLVQNADQVMPYFAFTELPPGFAGIIISGILAATMSTT
jgi:Na+/proline symporter|eukprot:COSAG01_NODE_1504_length_10094_cov_24.449925_8_plen_84_part_00